MTYGDIARANETIKTMVIEKTDKKTGKVISKDYAEVNQRIKAFRMLYPEGFILTEMVSNADGICVMRAKAGYYDNGCQIILATGTAYEKESSSFINQTSYIENCETSAVGRALGMLALGVDTSVASYEEVKNAIQNQEQPVKPVISLADKTMIETLAKKTDLPLEEIAKQAGVATIDEIPTYKVAAITKALKMRLARMNAEAKKNGSEGDTGLQGS